VRLLTNAYLRRKRWEFRSQAVAIVNALGESMGDSKGNGRYKEVSTDDMLQRIGLD
jgi:hypothetical protein